MLVKNNTFHFLSILYVLFLEKTYSLNQKALIVWGFTKCSWTEISMIEALGSGERVNLLNPAVFSFPLASNM